MTRTGLTAMTKVEVVVTGAHAPAVRELFHSVGATGYTTLSGVSGFGHHGHHQGRLLFNDQAPLELHNTVVPHENSETLVAGLRRLLSASSGVMFVSDTYVSRPEYFS